MDYWHGLYRVLRRSFFMSKPVPFSCESTYHKSENMLRNGRFCSTLSGVRRILSWHQQRSLKDVRAHCYCASLVRTLFIGARACHVIFERAHRVENLTKYRADLCVNLVCEYFCWKLGDPHFFFGRSLPFLTLSIILKNKKNLCVGSFIYLSYTIEKGSNWYMETGVRDLEVVFF